MAWSDTEWQTWHDSERGPRLFRVLNEAGFKPMGFLNGKPMIGKPNADWDEITALAAGLDAIEKEFGSDDVAGGVSEPEIKPAPRPPLKKEGDSKPKRKRSRKSKKKSKEDKKALGD